MPNERFHTYSFGFELVSELEVLLDPHGGHARKLSGHVRVVGQAVEVDAEVAHLDDLHLPAAHVIEDEVGRGRVQYSMIAIEPESRHCICRRGLGENLFSHAT